MRIIRLSLLLLGAVLCSSQAIADEDFEKLLDASARIVMGSNAPAVTANLHLNCSGDLCSTSESRTNWAGSTNEISIGTDGSSVKAIIVSYTNGDFDSLLKLMTAMFGKPKVESADVMSMTSKAHTWHRGYKYTLTKYSGSALNGAPLKAAFTLFIEHDS